MIRAGIFTKADAQGTDGTEGRVGYFKIARFIAPKDEVFPCP